MTHDVTDTCAFMPLETLLMAEGFLAQLAFQPSGFLRVGDLIVIVETGFTHEAFLT